MGRSFSFSLGEYYHIYNRGVDKRNIFTSADDYNRFKLLLYLCNSNKSVDIGNLQINEGKTFYEILNVDKGDDIVAIGSYVLMSNHFHILAKEIAENGISKFMAKVSTGYSVYFNTKYRRSGSLFEGRFKAIHANNDEYLKYLFSYMHLNPIKIIDPDWKENGINDIVRSEKHLLNYNNSSFLDYVGPTRPEGKLLNVDYFPEYFISKKNFKDITLDWLSYRTHFQKVEPSED